MPKISPLVLLQFKLVVLLYRVYNLSILFIAIYGLKKYFFMVCNSQIDLFFGKCYLGLAFYYVDRLRF